MPQTAIAAEVHQTFDIHRYLTPQITLDFVAFIDYFSNLRYFGFSQLLGSGVKIDTSFGQYFLRGRTTDTVYISQCDFNMLVSRDVNAGYSCQCLLLLNFTFNLDAVSV